jgi:hypothetical protein
MRLIVMRMWRAMLGAAIVCVATCASAQEVTSADARTQYPAFLSNSYFTFNVGSMRYIFSNDQLQPGFKAESVEIPHLSARVDLFGHHILEHLSAQVTYMRPARFVAYQNVNGDKDTHQISQAYGGFTLVWDVPFSDGISGYLEGGLGVTSRSGFEIGGRTVVQDAHFAAGLVGAGLSYRATPNTDFVFGATYSPGRKSFDQPSTRLYTAGIRYHMRPLPAADVEENRRSQFTFPANVLRLGYSTNLLSYGLNDFFSQTVPIFWGGKVETKQGFTFDYQRNIFHKKRFGFDMGASASYWTSNGDEEIFRTISVYPLLRYFLVRIDSAEVYGSYSVAGPTFLSQTVIDGRETGEQFTFQDFIGIGAFVGNARRINVEFGIKHYSNGNIFTRNASIKVPLTFTVGLAF